MYTFLRVFFFFYVKYERISSFSPTNTRNIVKEIIKLTASVYIETAYLFNTKNRTFNVILGVCDRCFPVYANDKLSAAAKDPVRGFHSPKFIIRKYLLEISVQKKKLSIPPGARYTRIIYRVKSAIFLL